MTPSPAGASSQTGADLDGDGIPDALEQQLAEKYAPVLFFDPGEPNYPVNVDWLLQRTSLSYYEECHYVGNQTPTVVQGPLSQGNLLDKTKDSPACRFAVPSFSPITSIQPDPDAARYLQETHPRCKLLLTVSLPEQAFFVANVSEEDRRGLTDTTGWTTYFHAYPTIDGGVMIQYCHLFAYNDYQSPKGLGSCDQHAGDWDASVQVQLGPDLNPEQVWFSRHTEDHPGTAIARDEVHFFQSTHPMVVVDSGGHGAYASPDDFCAYHQINIPLFSVNLGSGAWSDASSASDLHNIACFSGVPDPTKIERVGGTVWQTWTGGSVTSTVIEGGQGGPTCAGLPSGRSSFHPLNDQRFIGYSGLWGDPTMVSGLGFPPRGPVFQGLDSDTGRYTSWYNQASSSPWQPSKTPVPLSPTPTTPIPSGPIHGLAHIAYTGDRHGSVVLAAVSFAVATGIFSSLGFVATWTTPNGPQFFMSGDLAPGTTDDPNVIGFNLTFFTGPADTYYFLSKASGCHITLTIATQTALNGDFTCSALAAIGGGALAVHGTFDVRRG